MKLSLNAIKKRTSVRTYDLTPISEKEKEALRSSFAEAIPGPFGAKPRFILATREEIEDTASRVDEVKGGVRIGTYGMIVGAHTYIAGVVARRPFACVDFGYCMEGIILRATELGLGTCWIGGAFSRRAIAHALFASKEEFVPAMTPVGRSAERPSVQDRIVRKTARGGTRKKPEDLFFTSGTTGALETLDDSGIWAEILEAVRIGPSASNKQPWRLVLDKRDGEALHLVMHEDQQYNNMLGNVKLQELDMGIAMRHVEVASVELGVRGAWERLESDPVVLEKPKRYIATFRRVI